MSFHFVVGEVQEISDALTASGLGEFFFFGCLIIIDKNYMFSSTNEKKYFFCRSRKQPYLRCTRF